MRTRVDYALALLLLLLPGVAGASEYLDLVREATEVELKFGDFLLRIWGPAGVEEMDAAYGISVAIPGALPIGDDEGGSALVYTEGAQGHGLYFVGFGDLDRDDAVWIAPDLEALVGRGVGLAVGQSASRAKPNRGSSRPETFIGSNRTLVPDC